MAMFRVCDVCGVYYPEEEMFLHGPNDPNRPDVLCKNCNETSLLPGRPFSYEDYTGEIVSSQ